MCFPRIALMSQEPWKENSCVCNQVVEVCMPGLNQECLGLRWEGVHKILVTFITVNNILSGVVRVLLVGFFFPLWSSHSSIWWWCYQKSFGNWLGSKSTKVSKCFFKLLWFEYLHGRQLNRYCEMIDYLPLLALCLSPGQASSLVHCLFIGQIVKFILPWATCWQGYCCSFHHFLVMFKFVS